VRWASHYRIYLMKLWGNISLFIVGEECLWVLHSMRQSLVSLWCLYSKNVKKLQSCFLNVEEMIIKLNFLIYTNNEGVPWAVKVFRLWERCFCSWTESKSHTPEVVICKFQLISKSYCAPWRPNTNAFLLPDEKGMK
jgi:hypothetical protein